MKKHTWKKRITAMLLAGVMALSIVACAPGTDGGAGDTAGTSQAGEGKLFSEPTEISTLIQSHISWPYNRDWVIWKEFERLTGATFNVTAIPSTEFSTKMNLIMAGSGEELPDLIYADGAGYSKSLAPTGALIAIDDYIDMMPNYTAFWDSFPEDERERRLNMRKFSDGKTYYPQIYGTDERQGIRAWMYRKDIFEKHDIAIPTTMEEVYQVSKQLKEIYPDSYPFCLREGLRNIGVMGSHWKPYFDWDMYYDFNAEKWSYGVTEPTMLEIVKYMRRMMEEGLIPPGYLTDPTKTWEGFMTTDRGFILCDFVVRVDNFNNPCRLENPEYTLAAMVPPKSDLPGAESKVNKFNVDTKGYMIINSGDKKRIENAVKLVDWMYSDEAADMIWGVEGVSYELKEDGSKTYIRPADGDLEGEYGIFSYGTYLRVDPAAARDIASPEQQVAVDIALANTMDQYDPSNYVVFTPEEQDQYELLNDSIQTYVEQELHKFLLCENDLSMWDAFVKSVEELGVNDLLAIYEAAYNRVK